MIEPQLILTPWNRRLMEALLKAQHQVLIVSPYIKFGIAKAVYSALSGRCITVRTLTRFKFEDFASGASDIDAAYALSLGANDDQFEARFNNTLHAKIYLIDGRVVFVGSSNLTFSGLTQNYEAVACITNTDFLKQISVATSELWASSTSATRSDFEEMIERRRRVPPNIAREVEHIYNTRRSIDIFTESAEDAADPSRWLADAEQSANPEVRETENDNIIISQFLERLEKIFKLDVKESAEIYVEAITYPSRIGQASRRSLFRRSTKPVTERYEALLTLGRSWLSTRKATSG
jgi:hypothetical protein